MPNKIITFEKVNGLTKGSFFLNFKIKFITLFKIGGYNPIAAKIRKTKLKKTINQLNRFIQKMLIR